MRMRRLKVFGIPAHYHCMTRVVGGAPLLGTVEKEVLRKQIWKMAEFCGVDVITYSIMSNHFHVFLHVPEPNPDLSDDVLLYRISLLYDPVKVEAVEALLKTESRDAVRAKYLARMGDVSVYMKELKQRFSIWFNKRHRRYGTLWAERFKSVLVQGARHALITVAAYVDLNPVRGGFCADPKDYRYSGYGEAMGGSVRARQGLGRLFDDGAWRSLANEYRIVLYGKGYFTKAGGSGGISWEKTEDVLKRGGKLTSPEVLRCRVRYFTDGLVLGTREFVDRVYGELKPKLDLQRARGSYSMAGCDWGDLVVMRRLRGRVIERGSCSADLATEE